MKHGHGKITFPGPQGKGAEEYEGDWEEDKMNGHGRYIFTSGAEYIGSWKHGMMHGKGKKINADGTFYEGEWEKNLMHGDGVYLDQEKQTWQGLFINGSFDSKI